MDVDKCIKEAHADSFRRCLLEGDVDGIIELWHHCAPHLACSSRKEAEYSFHLARTGAQSIPLRLRKYSARWLNERGFGSFVPQDLLPKKPIPGIKTVLVKC